MSKLRGLLMVTIILVSGLNTWAQKGRVTKPAVKTTKTTAVKTVDAAAQKIYHTMLPATAKIMFIDSMVVGKSQFLSKIPLPHETGTLTAKGRTTKGDALAQYENNFGDRRIYADGDTLNSTLFAQTLQGNGWDKPISLADFTSVNYAFQNYPFLCSDGVTLFFSAQGPNSMGGRDIFMTIYDSDKAEWYEPQNYGLPFNSTANDYLLAIDDLDSIGWLVSDRFQPKDSVCIYTFVPTTPRKDFANDNLTEAQLERYAKITSIADTWKFGQRDQAIKRLQALLRKNSMDQSETGMRFVVNDQQIVTSVSSFKSGESRKLYAQLEELKDMYSSTVSTLSSKRTAYHQAKATEKSQLAEDILKLERQQLQQQAEINSIEKKIRANEMR